MKTICKNCGNEFDGNYCNQCGQKASTRRLNLKRIFYEVRTTLFQLDYGLLYTTKKLLTRPGKTIRDYLDGQRVYHFKPFTYLFLLATVYIILVRTIGSDALMSDVLKGISDGWGERSSNPDSFNVFDWLGRNYAYTVLLIIPIISLASFIAFRKMKYNYAEHLVLNSYIVGLNTFIFIGFTILKYFVKSVESLYLILDIAQQFISIAVISICYYSTFNRYNPLIRIGLSLVTFVLIFVLIILLLFLVTGIYKITVGF